MDRQQSFDDKQYRIDMTLQGGRYCMSIGKGVIRALGSPSHVSLKISDTYDAISIFPCDAENVMSFRVPAKLFINHSCVMRITSKQFVHGIMLANGLDLTRTYVLLGNYSGERNTAVFSLTDGISLRKMSRSTEAGAS